MKKKTKILFIRPSRSSFIQWDLEMLQKRYEVRVYDFVTGKKNMMQSVASFLGMFKGVLWSDLTFTWFAGYQAYRAVSLSRRLGRRSIVIVGGYEFAKVPEIDFGQLLDPEATKRVRFVIDNADRILVVDGSLKEDVVGLLKVKGDNILTVPTGFDPGSWKPGKEKEELVITVTNVNREVVKRKGLDTFVKAAKYVPKARFVLVGKHLDDSVKDLKRMAPYNVEFVQIRDFSERKGNRELLEWYQRAKVYCQLSRHEGLPTALCEAMLCECVPVATKLYGMPTAMGDTGFYVPYGNPRSTGEAIKKALAADSGKRARKRIQSLFPTKRREKEITAIINDLRN